MRDQILRGDIRQREAVSTLFPMRTATACSPDGVKNSECSSTGMTISKAAQRSDMPIPHKIEITKKEDGLNKEEKHSQTRYAEAKEDNEKTT